jgi:hypothetical protein
VVAYNNSNGAVTALLSYKGARGWWWLWACSLLERCRQLGRCVWGGTGGGLRSGLCSVGVAYTYELLLRCR